MTDENPWKANLGDLVRLHDSPQIGPHRHCIVEAVRFTRYRTPEKPPYLEYGLCPWQACLPGEYWRREEAGVLLWVDGAHIELEHKHDPASQP